MWFTAAPKPLTYVQVWSKSDQRRLRKTLHKQANKQTDRQTNKHNENNGHLAVNQYFVKNGLVLWSFCLHTDRHTLGVTDRLSVRSALFPTRTIRTSAPRSVLTSSIQWVVCWNELRSANNSQSYSTIPSFLHGKQRDTTIMHFHRYS